VSQNYDTPTFKKEKPEILSEMTNDSILKSLYKRNLNPPTNNLEEDRH